MKLTSVVRVEGDYGILENLTMIANGVWNMSVYANERELDRVGRYLFYNKTYEKLKNDPLYNLLPSQSAQAILQKHDGDLRLYLSLRRRNPAEGERTGASHPRHQPNG